MVKRDTVNYYDQNAREDSKTHFQLSAKKSLANLMILALKNPLIHYDIMEIGNGKMEETAHTHALTFQSTC